MTKEKERLVYLRKKAKERLDLVAKDGVTDESPSLVPHGVQKQVRVK